MTFYLQCINPLLDHSTCQFFHQHFFPQLSINDEKTFRTNYLPTFVGLCCPPPSHISAHGKGEHVLNWAVSVSLFCRDPFFWSEYLCPINDLWKFYLNIYVQEMIYQNIWHLVLPSHMLHIATCVFIKCWHADRVIVALFYFCQNNTSLLHNWTMPQ